MSVRVLTCLFRAVSMEDNFFEDNFPDTIVPIVPDVPEVVSMDCTSAFTTTRVLILLISFVKICWMSW